MVVLSKRNSASKSSCRTVGEDGDPMVETHTVDSSLSLMLDGALVVLGEQVKQFGVRRMQYSVPAEQVGDVFRVLPIAKLPIGGKQPACSSHCALQPIGDVARTKNAVSTATNVQRCACDGRLCW